MNANLYGNRVDEVALSADQALGHIAATLPGATAVFRRMRLGLCSASHLSLRQAASAKGLDVDALVSELLTVQRQALDTQPLATDPASLIEHILSRYHEVHRAQFPELIRMARRVEAVHQQHPSAPVGLANFLVSMEQELLQHMHKEEAILFPMMQAGRNPYISEPISMMRFEHVDHAAALNELAQLTHDATPPEDACNTWRALYAGIAQLTDDLTKHIHLENNVLFVQFESTTASSSMGCTAGPDLTGVR